MDLENIAEAAPLDQVMPSPEILATGKDGRKKWGYSLDAGFQLIPDVFFKCQRLLGLKPVDMLILLNITMHWWDKDDLPHPRPSVIASRVGVSTRTVERRLIALQKNGFLRRLESVQKKGRAVRMFDLSGLVEKLKEVAVQNIKLRRPGLRAMQRASED